MMAMMQALLALRWLAVWRRNARVWGKLAGPAMLGNIGEPLLYLLALGFGLGALVGEIEGMDYIAFLASGFVCASVMNTASFESVYSAYTRMAVQETWTAMLYTPLSVADILIGEVAWAASKALLSAFFVLIVAAFLGAVDGWLALWVLPVALLTGVAFSAMALVITAVSRSYDFFLYYFTLLLTPMLLFSGVFFPLDDMPAMVSQIAAILPLWHAIELVRPLMTGQVPTLIPLHLLVLSLYALLPLWLAGRLVSRRLHR
ncbi:MAG: ABC transporter permease [Chromatiales bacterium]|nr:ABC transporter permease [Gammaproteobacteria bacterium]MBW6475976.1 ABC transporter permease [Chromatiales bacterium]